MGNQSRYFAPLIFFVNIFVNGWASSPEHLNGMFLRLYFGNAKDNYTDEKVGNAVQLVSKLDFYKPVVLYIHGFTESVESNSTQTVVNAYLQRDQQNLLVLDYRDLSNKHYYELAVSVSKIGTVLAKALNQMTIAGMDPSKLHIVGHSIGAQIAGHVGRKTIFKVPRITGLDPAGPFFNLLEVALSPRDARFVDVLHTDAGIYGIAKSSGSADFYPNGGHRLQPGCPQGAPFYSIEDFCSHRRSWKYYAESVMKESSFYALKCSSLLHFSLGMCEKNEKVPMGYATPTNAVGNFYLITRHESPFGMGHQGLRDTHQNLTSAADVQGQTLHNFLQQPSHVLPNE